ncbi:hypothetical protein [Lutimonas vermicola]|uniref:Uncharacterized protein n=1 Tax=Lutimonas vermicola TaxID=414288 RepID=A0ABU9L0I3_9FLAO
MAVLLYLIGFFTQAQEPSEQEDEQITETSTENNIENLKRDTNDAAYEVLYFLEEDFSIKTDFKTIR